MRRATSSPAYPHAFANLGGARTLLLRLVATSDLHMQIRPYDYVADRPAPGGLADAAGLVAALRAGARNTLLLDNGDFLQGNPMGDLAAGREGEHPMIAAMNTLGYDAATLGNHELDYGLATLLRALAGARFPVVCANLTPRPQQRPLAPPYTILERRFRDDAGGMQRLRIGVIGFLPPQVAIWNRKHLDGAFSTHGILDAARARIPELRAAGADLVVALSHSGIGEDDENASLALAALPGIDALIAGHSHRLFPEGGQSGRLHGTPAVMPGVAGSHLGVIDLALEQANGHWRVADATATLHPVTTASPEAAQPVLAATDAAHAATLAHIRRPVGETRVPLHTFFAHASPAPALRLLAAAQAWRARQALAGTALETLPLLSAAPPYKAGGAGGWTHVPPGAMTMRHIADLCPFPNRLAILRLTGADLAAWLEHAARAFAPLAPAARDRPLTDPAIPPHDFDTITGVTYRIDLSTTGPRIRDLALDGTPVSPTAEVLVATSDYRANGGGGFPGTGADRIAAETDESLQDVLARYLAETGPVERLPPAPWRLSGPPGASAVLETTAEARGVDSGTHGPSLERMGAASEGNDLYRLTF